MHALAFTHGDEALAGLHAYCVQHGIAAAHFVALGALAGARVAYFDWETKDYEAIEVDEQVEVLSLVGTVALHEGEPLIHAHIVLGRRDGSACGGHLLEARVRPTLELVLTEGEQPLHKAVDPESGLPVLKLD